MRITPTDPGTPMLIRTDFTDGQAWQRVADAALAPSSHGFRAQLELVDDPWYEGLTVEQAVAALPAGQGPFLTFLADPITITDPEHPIVVVDLGWEPGRHFRVAGRDVERGEQPVAQQHGLGRLRRVGGCRRRVPRVRSGSRRPGPAPTMTR